MVVVSPVFGTFHVPAMLRELSQNGRSAPAFRTTSTLTSLLRAGARVHRENTAVLNMSAIIMIVSGTLFYSFAACSSKNSLHIHASDMNINPLRRPRLFSHHGFFDDFIDAVTPS